MNGGARPRPSPSGARASHELTLCLPCMHTHGDLGFAGGPAQHNDAVTRSEGRLRAHRVHERVFHIACTRVPQRINVGAHHSKSCRVADTEHSLIDASNALEAAGVTTSDSLLSYF